MTQLQPHTFKQQRQQLNLSEGVTGEWQTGVVWEDDRMQDKEYVLRDTGNVMNGELKNYIWVNFVTFIIVMVGTQLGNKYQTVYKYLNKPLICSSDKFMPGKLAKTKPAAATMCLIGQWAFNRFLFAILIVSHSTSCYNRKTGWDGPGRGNADKTDNNGRSRIYHTGVKQLRVWWYSSWGDRDVSTDTHFPLDLVTL